MIIILILIIAILIGKIIDIPLFYPSCSYCESNNIQKNPDSGKPNPNHIEEDYICNNCNKKFWGGGGAG